MPEGPTPVVVDGEEWEAQFARVAVNVLRRTATEGNGLPALIRAWFGPDAGLPGTDFHVVFEGEAGGAYRLSPLRRPERPPGPELWRQHPREQIPGLFGLQYGPALWTQGFVKKGDRGRTAPFVYCGKCEFERWEGDRPITVQWRLRRPVPERCRSVLDVPTGPDAEG